MESWKVEGEGRTFEIRVDEVDEFTSDLIKTLIEIDLQTFSESTFSQFTAAALLRHGRVYVLRADGSIIGTCVCMRSWDRPNEAMILSMGIRPGWRGRGLGQRFVAGVLSRLRQRGLRTASLMVGSDNRRAIRLYQDVGFEVVEEGPTDHRTGESLWMMRMKLVEEELNLVELVP